MSEYYLEIHGVSKAFQAVQALDKRTLTGGTVEEFKRFLKEKTGKTFRRVK